MLEKWIESKTDLSSVTQSWKRSAMPVPTEMITQAVSASTWTLNLISGSVVLCCMYNYDIHDYMYDLHGVVLHILMYFILILKMEHVSYLYAIQDE